MMSIYEGPIAAFYFSELFRYHPSIHLVLQRAVPKQTVAQSVEIVSEEEVILSSCTNDSILMHLQFREVILHEMFS